MNFQTSFSAFPPCDVQRGPEMAMLTKSDILVGVGEAKEGVPATFRICSLLHVTAVEPLTAASSGANQ